MPKARPDSITLARKVVFLHIAKTAGTSITHFFRRRLPAHSICSHGDFLAFPKQSGAALRALEKFQFISGHFGYSDIAYLLPQAYSFTFLRDPVDRALSFYRFCLHPDMQKRFPVAGAAATLGLDGFIASELPEVCEMLDNQQTWQLARSYWREDRAALHHLEPGELLQLATGHLGEFDRVGLTDCFQQDFQAILSDLGIAEPAPTARQLRTPAPLLQSELSPASLAILRERQQLDYALLAKARELHRSRAAAETGRE